MSQSISRCLQSGAHDDESHGQPDHVASTELVSDHEVDDTSNESAQAVAGNGDAGNNIIGVSELITEMRILQ